MTEETKRKMIGYMAKMKLSGISIDMKLQDNQEYPILSYISSIDESIDNEQIEEIFINILNLNNRYILLDNISLIEDYKINPDNIRYNIQSYEFIAKFITSRSMLSAENTCRMSDGAVYEIEDRIEELTNNPQNYIHEQETVIKYTYLLLQWLRFKMERILVLNNMDVPYDISQADSLSTLYAGAKIITKVFHFPNHSKDIESTTIDIINKLRELVGHRMKIFEPNQYDDDIYNNNSGWEFKIKIPRFTQKSKQLVKNIEDKYRILREQYRDLIY
jgi:hypothetical protein